MRKRIQLRGISRTPSDRMTSDGGCAESLNVQLEEQEIAPILPPEDVTAMFGEEAAAGLPGPALFLHKVASHVNLIFFNEEAGTVCAYVKPSGQPVRGPIELFALYNGETINGVTAIGNTLVVSTSLRMEYVLFKNGEYIDLGDQIPIPAVEFTAQEEDGVDCTGYLMEVVPQIENGSAIWNMEDDVASVFSDIIDVVKSIFSNESEENVKYNELALWNIAAWGNALAGDLDYKENLLEVRKLLWDLVNAAGSLAQSRGCFANPVFARCALRLYDGTYIYQSVPVLLGAGGKVGNLTVTGGFVQRRFYGAQFWGHSSGTTYKSSFLKASYEKTQSAKAVLRHFDYENWEDIIESVDIFISTGVRIPEAGSEIISVKRVSEDNYRLEFFLDDKEERTRNILLSKSSFFKVASFPIKSLYKLEEGYDLLSDSRFRDEDFLPTQEQLPDDFFSANRKVAENITQYNKRLIISNLSQELTTGYQFLNGAIANKIVNTEGAPEPNKYEFRFHILDSANKERLVFARTYSMETGFPGSVAPYVKHVPVNLDEYVTISHERGYNTPEPAKSIITKPYAWLAYPDPRCFKVDVRITKGDEVILKSYDMEPHPNLNCAFLFLGLDKELGEGGNELTEWDTTEDRMYREDNIVWQSVSENPFAFQANGRLTFYSDIIAIANATKALSEGQFGQFPVYVFTSDGIWSIPLTDEGNFARTIPLSRDVALSKNSVIPIEQAIVFVSEQGVMLLEGSQVTCLSPNMNGAHYVSPEDLLGRLSRHPMLKDYVPAFSGDLPFKTFVSDAKIAFDYSNRRILLFNEAYDYQYVYVFKTQTWHKMSLFGKGLQMYSALNSYPDCFVDTMEGGKHFLRNFSVEYDPSKQQDTLPGLIITRPFDLEEPDIRKTITDLRIRGNFARGDVRYVLLASMDGIHWGILPSLRGGSYKLFRLALLTDLSPTERISWIDIDYETRFDNRLR